MANLETLHRPPPPQPPLNPLDCHHVLVRWPVLARLVFAPPPPPPPPTGGTSNTPLTIFALAVRALVISVAPLLALILTRGHPLLEHKGRCLELGYTRGLPRRGWVRSLVHFVERQNSRGVVGRV